MKLHPLVKKIDNYITEMGDGWTNEIMDKIVRAYLREREQWLEDELGTLQHREVFFRIFKKAFQLEDEEEEKPAGPTDGYCKFLSENPPEKGGSIEYPKPKQPEVKIPEYLKYVLDEDILVDGHEKLFKTINAIIDILHALKEKIERLEKECVKEKQSL
jgi:hypothetical protein